MPDPFDDSPMKCHRRGFARRELLIGGAAGAVLGGAGVWALRQSQPGLTNSAPPFALEPGKSGIPGPYPGRVIEVHHPDAARGNLRNRPAVREMVRRGVQELTGADDWVAGWRALFHRGDRVGIKVVPVGRPDSISSHEVVLETIAALNETGVRPNDILVFDRYENEYRSCNYDKILPDGVHWECESVAYDDPQVNIDGQLPEHPRSKRVSGYDPDVFRELAFCLPQHHPDDDRRFRSHLSMIISRKVDKFISIPVLKDHRSSGVTCSLKNLSHGSVNNVSRSHIINFKPDRQAYAPGLALNQCGTFIPSIVSLPKLREKAVLQILDGLVATYEGGPGIWNPTFATWNANSLLFATDPVALDHIGWEIIDAKRAEHGWPPVATMGLEGNQNPVEKEGRIVPSEQLPMRQPEHIPLAATLGLGIFTRQKIGHRKIELT
jgi:hypothetical protein